LVREGCPVCRRSYFEDEDEASEGNRGNASFEQQRGEEVIDLERGEEHTAASRVIVVVED
jgi:hypothetical protein